VADTLQVRLEQALREREAAEHALRDLQARIDNAQQLAHMGDYDWEIATDQNTWSDQLFRIFGYAPGDLAPDYQRFLSMIHPEDQERIRAIHQAAYASGEPFELVERIVRPDGEVRFLSTNGQVVTDEDGTPLRMRGTCIDITERVHAEEAREAHAAQVHEELTRRQAALEINDSVVQGLTAALYALELADTDAVRDYVRRTLDAARAVITDLVGPSQGPVAPGDLVRTSPSTLGDA
jgi:PAS domain S-box-containing protein